MEEARFREWLDVERGLSTPTVGSRVSNCRRVERFEGDLDIRYDADGLAGLIGRLNYSREDERYRRSPKHAVPIDGDIYNGTATLKNAVRLYRDFRREGVSSPPDRAPAKLPTQERRRPPRADWPIWPQPNDEDLLDLARAMAPFVRFLDPHIVAAIAEDNRRMGAEWSSRLEALGIDPAIWLWEGSPCSFPGVRRHVGAAELAMFRQRAVPHGVLALDDNDYPKHVWAYVFTGKPFGKQGPDGYQLAHVFDHKHHGDRWRNELDLPPDMGEPARLYGLFTSAAGTVYAPGVFVKPTDFSPRLRSLIQRRAQELYGDACRVLPPPLTVKPCEDPASLVSG